jgi:23S rRNA (uridine2552-2'-O)-methyltransferase
MAPHTSGIKDADAALSAELVDRCLDIADALPRPGGNFVAKIFQGSDFEAVRKRASGSASSP